MPVGSAGLPENGLPDLPHLGAADEVDHGHSHRWREAIFSVVGQGERGPVEANSGKYVVAVKTPTDYHAVTVIL